MYETPLRTNNRVQRRSNPGLSSSGSFSNYSSGNVSSNGSSISSGSNYANGSSISSSGYGSSGGPPPLSVPPPPPPPLSLGGNPKIASGVGINVNTSSSSINLHRRDHNGISSPLSPISSPTLPTLTSHASSASLLPQTPQQRMLLRKPMSMQTLSTVRSSTRLGMTPRSNGASAAETYKGTIHVGVRERPISPTSQPSGWFLNPEMDVVEHESAGNFRFDKVYNGNASNSSVFEESVEHLIEQVTNGFNATVFAYGTTGSGKTYTMQGTEGDPGVIPQSVARLFERVSDEAVVKLSYFEIYNERVYDLLSADGTKPTEVMLRDGANGEPKVIGQREVDTRSASELLNWVASGDQLRRTSSTQYNEHSSRSHAVVRIQVVQNSIQSILYLCDLAGSERAVVQSERRKEGSYINKSLLTLSTVISILSQGGSSHVPYRDSKLTRLLQPSLSGTALVTMLCTIHTASGSAAETLNSIRFAAKAKNITVLARRNSVFDEGFGSGGAASARLVEQLQMENDSLRRENDKLRTEREDLQDRLDVLNAAGNPDAEESLEAVMGINLPADGSTSSGGSSLMSRQRSESSTEFYKLENEKLHQKITHLVSEISDLDTKLSTLEDTVDIPPYQDEINELKERIVDKDHLIKCLSQINDAHKKVESWGSTSADGSLSSIAIEDLRI